MALADRPTAPTMPVQLRTLPATIGRFALLFGIACGVFAIVLLIAGKNPAKAYADVFATTLGSSYGFSEVLVKMIPLVLTAVAAALPARLGLINIGAEGQMYAGALTGSWVALTFGSLPAWILIPLMLLFGFAGGAAWGAAAGVLRARDWAPETVSTLLMNYVAPLAVSFVVYGAWRDPKTANFPQTAEFSPAAQLPSFAGTRVHLGLVLAIIALLLFYFLFSRTRWGLEMRAVGGNPDAARRNGIPVGRYLIIALLIGGGIAGIAGIAEVSAIQGRLRPGFSPGYGFIGFLASWLAGGSPVGILAAAFLLAVVTAGGDVLQMSQGIPFSVLDILMALILFVVLARGPRKVGR